MSSAEDNRGIHSGAKKPPHVSEGVMHGKEMTMEPRSIPVMVDDRKEVGEFEMTRVAYYYVEAVEPLPDIPIDHRKIGIPVLALEFSGVIHRPTGRETYFKSADQIEALFRRVERHPSLYVDSDNIWIPNRLFNRRPERGDIFRVPFGLFRRLYSICRDDATLDAGISGFSGAQDLILFSEAETKAFAQWTRGILESVVAAYPKNEGLKLKWRE